MNARSLMVLGTMSSAGKSLLVTGLCRIFARRGVRVAPFKAQNMSNNAAVCSGGEIGRAQAVQARAAGIEPCVEMNPILLKPEADSHSQVIVRGKLWESLDAKDYYKRKQVLWQAVTESYDLLQNKYDLIIMEGAGSPAEVNLMENDIVNLAAARYAHAPCLLAGNIDRGGVFAQLLGTLWLLQKDDSQMVKGLIVNKFRGDPDLFVDGIKILEEKSGKPVIGVVPYIQNKSIPEEDAATITHSRAEDPHKDLAVIHLPHISNFDDLDPFKFHHDIQVRFVDRIDLLINPAAIIIPGSKSTISDMDWLRSSGLAQRIVELANNGTSVVGICGGFQMLGSEITDDLAVESSLRNSPGLGLLPVSTRMLPDKTVTRSQARITEKAGFFGGIYGSMVSGYEIHMGRTGNASPVCEIITRENIPASDLDGACSPDGKIWGTYLHGIFDNDGFRHAWLKNLGIRTNAVDFQHISASSFDLVADTLESNLNMDLLDKIIAEGLA